ncbi:MAG TPA: sigma-70 family RNA polymerase sigma factor [Solirubrobacterales bacterium]
MDDLAGSFEQLRPQLLRVAYSTLGSLSEAEDAVQDAWLRLQRTDPDEIENLGAWLTTVVGRLSLDALRAARRRREAYVGQWLPEPVVEEIGAEEPGERVSLDESVATALLVVLERLSPAERMAFLLHDVFAMPFDQVAEVVGRSPAAVRQLAVRARGHVEAQRPRFPPSAEEHERIVGAFVEACGMGDLERLLEVLDPEVVFRSDGGGRVPAARFPLEGAERVARTLLSLERKRQHAGHEMRGTPGLINGLLGFVYYEGENLNVLSFTIDSGRIVALDVVRNPDKLRHVQLLER